MAPARYDPEGLVFIGWPALAPRTYAAFTVCCVLVWCAAFWLLGLAGLGHKGFPFAVRIALTVIVGMAAMYPPFFRPIVLSAPTEIQPALRRAYTTHVLVTGVMLGMIVGVGAWLID